MGDEGTQHERLEAMAIDPTTSLMQASDFLGLRLMLALERRPVEPCGRAVFPQVRPLATDAVAAADGRLIARETDRDGIDLAALVTVPCGVICDAALELARRNTEQSDFKQS